MRLRLLDENEPGADATRWVPPEGTRHRRTTKAERRAAKREMLSMKRSKRWLANAFGRVTLEVREVHTESFDTDVVNEWARYLRTNSNREYVHLRLTVPMKVTYR